MLDREEVPAEAGSAGGDDRLDVRMGADVARASQRLAVCGGSAGGV